MTSREEYDQNQIYCRKLGHALTFNYCRRENTDRPCARLLECWAASLPVAAWLGEHFQPQEVSHLGQDPPSKLSTLAALIEKARRP